MILPFSQASSFTQTGESAKRTSSPQVIGKGTIIWFVLSHSRCYMPAIKALSCAIAATCSFGNTSKLYQVRMAHHGSKIVACFAKHQFGSAFMGPIRNVPRLDVAESKADKIAAEQLHGRMRDKSRPPVTPVPMTIIRGAKEKLNSLISDGICAGMRLHIAHEVLVNDSSITDVVADLGEGGTAEAAAYQSVYQNGDSEVNSPDNLKRVFTFFLRQIAKSQTGNNLFQVKDYTPIHQALTMFDRTSQPYREDGTTRIPSIVAAVQMIYEEECAKTSSTFISFNPQTKECTVTNYALFQKHLKEAIDNKYIGGVVNASSPESPFRNDPAALEQEIVRLETERSENKKAVKWIVSFLQCDSALNKEIAAERKPKTEMSMTTRIYQAVKKIFVSETSAWDRIMEQISDLEIQFAIRRILLEAHTDIVYEAVAALAGLDVIDVSDKIGHHSTYLGDVPMLANLNKLENGFYGFDFSTGDGAHAVSYQKISDTEGYIVDPNGFAIKCGDVDDTRKKMLQLLSFYEEPIFKNPPCKTNGMYHALRFYAIKQRR